tara:strand:- start:2124 stop:2957 length:834 start_codon:yes stop_codon:yes gene_type:complete
MLETELKTKDKEIKIYPYNKLKDNFIISEEVKYLTIDIGLSQEAVPISKWLTTNGKKDRGVIAVEPLPYNIECLLQGKGKNRGSGQVSLNENLIIGNNQPGFDIKNKFILIEAAIDNVKTPTEKTFYVATPDTGNCSLIAENITGPSNPNNIEKEIQVTAIPLSYIFDKIDKSRFPFIENLKIDTEGNDINVIKSCNPEDLKRVVFLSIECALACPQGRYRDTATPIINYLKPLGFEVIDNSPSDYKFINTNLKDLIKEHNLTCMDGDHGIFKISIK